MLGELVRRLTVTCFGFSWKCGFSVVTVSSAAGSFFEAVGAEGADDGRDLQQVGVDDEKRIGAQGIL
jgi:hypothetical protein